MRSEGRHGNSGLDSGLKTRTHWHVHSGWQRTSCHSAAGTVSDSATHCHRDWPQWLAAHQPQAEGTTTTTTSLRAAPRRPGTVTLRSCPSHGP
eukprot:2341970-Rhodomonas_salina.1